MIEREVLKRRKRKKILFYIKLIVFVAVITILVKGISIFREYGGVELDSDITITIPDGAGTSRIADILEENKIIKNPFLFTVSARIGGFDTKMRSGVFTLTDDMSYREIMVHLTSNSGDTYVKVTIPEGYEISQIGERLEQAGVVTAEEFMEAVKLSYDYKFLENIPDRKEKLEGYLFPDTYNFREGDSAIDVVRAMLDNFDKHFSAECYERANELNMTVDEIVTLASIIERETNAEFERKKVAGVFYNRLAQGMRLQSCATVQYALGERKSVLSIQDTKIASPYNTYENDGLPIGPIASPGASCIEAALYPESTDALFFVLDSDGNHVFSKTYDEHITAKKNAAIKVE